MDGFYPVSDNVEPQIITTITDDCLNSNCCLSARLNNTTLIANSNHYNKDGMSVIKDDNDKTVDVCCRICWKEWTVSVKNKSYSKILKS